MHQPDELLHNRITRRRFPVAFGLGLATMFRLLRLADGIHDEKPAPAKEPPTTPNYGAWRPRTAGGPTMPTV